MYPFLASTQCFSSVDPLTYISVRRFYIVRNNLPKDFDFNKQLIEVHSHSSCPVSRKHPVSSETGVTWTDLAQVHLKDFQNLVGVSSWMWLLIISTLRELRFLHLFLESTSGLLPLSFVSSGVAGWRHQVGRPYV